MREVTVRVTCDSCQDRFDETAEGSNSVRLIVSGKEFEMDMCDACLGSAFLQEARAVKSSGKSAGKVSCHCGKVFKTPRGLSRHQTVTHG